jgi:plasmid replication initiation protein
MRESLQLEGKHPRWADLKRQVIEPSLKAVNAQTDLDVKYKPFKKARSIVGLEFVFSVKPRVIQQQVPLDL